MRVFVTGATGSIETVVFRDLIKAGHTVLGLARGANSDLGALTKPPDATPDRRLEATAHSGTIWPHSVICLMET